MMDMKRTLIGVFPILIAVFSSLSAVQPGPTFTVSLPEAQKKGGLPLMEALADRQSTREFADREIPLETLSNLLWAADGVNRRDSGKRTAPSAHDRREIDIYVITPEAYYRFVPEDHSLKLLGHSDLRKLAGTQDYVATAPLNLVYVADFAKVPDTVSEERTMYAAASTGCIAQNVYLFCASEGLGTVVRGSIDRAELASALKLGPERKIILAQTVGYPNED